jgi:uncharacterized protein, YfiH family
MQVREKGGVVYLTYPSLERLDMVRHGFSTRLGGVSQGIYASMNLSFSRGDERGAVLENYRRIADAIGFDLECIVTSDQTHTANVRVVTEADKGCGLTRARPYQDVDGMITNVPGLMLATFYADCVPLYLVDPVKKAVGLSHSGWKGTVGKIGLATVQAMEREYGTDPKDLAAAVGPSICQECYEVSEDVIGEFERTFSRDLWDKLFYRKPDGKYQLDLWEANRQVFIEAGVDAAQITLPGICTCCNPQFLFSHRASKGKRGNLGAFLGLV